MFRKLLLLSVVSLLVLSNLQIPAIRAESVSLYDSPGYKALKYLGYDSHDTLLNQGNTFKYDYVGSRLKANSSLFNDVRPQEDGKTLDYTGSEVSDCPGSWWRGSKADIYRLGGSNCALYVAYHVFGYLQDVEGHRFDDLPTNASSNWFSVWKIHLTLTDYLPKGIFTRVINNPGANYRSRSETLELLDQLLPGDIVLWSRPNDSYWAHASVYVGQQDGYYFFAHSGVVGRGPELITSASLMNASDVKGGNMRIHEVFRLASASLQITKTIAADQQLCQLASLSLEGAKFAVYDEQQKLISTLTTDKNGKCPLLTDLQAGVYTVEEIKAPEGFKLPEEPFNRQRVVVRTNENASVSFADYPAFDPISIFLRKNDALDGQPVSGAQYTVYVYPGQHFNSVAEVNGEPERVWVFETDENGCIDLGSDNCLISGELYRDEDGTIVALPGSYLLKETLVPEGYRPSEDFLIYHDTSASAEQSHQFNTALVAEQPEVHYFIRKLDSQGHYLSGALLQLYEGDRMLAEYTSGDSDIDISDKVMAGRQYRLHEVQAPEGYLISDDVIFTVEACYHHEVHTVTMSDERIPLIHTQAYFDNQTAVCEKPLKAYDAVHMSELTAGKQYQLRGRIVDCQNNDTVLSEASLTFTCQSSTEEQIMEFDLPADLEAGRKLVVFEELYQNDQLIARHCDPADNNQQLYIPKLTTEVAYLSRYLVNEDNQLLTDTITYQSLQPEKNYKVVTEIIDLASTECLLDFSSDFSCQKENGSVEIKKVIDGRLLAGRNLVVYEKIYLDDVLVAGHCDNSDEKQYFSVADLKTKAELIEKEGSQTLTVRDVVYYENLPAGTYRFAGQLIDKESGSFLIGEDGLPIRCFKEVDVTKNSGQVEMLFEISREQALDREIVVFETVEQNDRLFAAHQDLLDENQTVCYHLDPAVETGQHDLLTIGIIIMILSTCGLILLSRRNSSNS